MAAWCTTRVVILLSVLLSVTTLTQACSCSGRQSLQRLFCSSNYVIRATVRSVWLPPDNYADKVYNVTVLQVYKSNGTHLVNGRTASIYTPKYDSFCGVSLSTNKTYLLAGSSTNGRNFIYLCDGVYTEWRSVSTIRRRELDSVYARHC